MMKLEASWHTQLKEEITLPYIQQLKSFLEEEKKTSAIIYPPESQVFNAFLHTPFSKVKAVIVGQDPYHGKGQAHGLCFSVAPGTPFPPSLKNIYKELVSDLGLPHPETGCLDCWAKQGVLLLNSSLTVREGSPNSHAGRGWERFTDAVIAKVFAKQDPIVFILWGKSAQDKYHRIIQGKQSCHEVLMAPHPSPLSAYSGFLGSRPFSKCNAFLSKMGKEPIDWRVL